MRLLIVSLIVILLWVVPILAQVPPYFEIVGMNPNVPDGTPGKLWFSFRFSRLATPDIEPRPDGQRGSGQWTDWPADPAAHGCDRIGYDTAYCFWEHQDPGVHNFVVAIRFFVQRYGNAFTVQINDRYMREDPFRAGRETGGVPPYPYEVVPAVSVDHIRPGGIVEFIHQREKGRQVLATLDVPAISPTNSRVRWYYQLGGLFVAELDGVPLARVIISATHPAYTYRIRGVDTR